MDFQPIQSVPIGELVDFEDQRHLFDRMLGHSDEKRIMFIQAPGTCGKTSLLRLLRDRCEQQGTRCCWIDFRDQLYNNPYFTLAREMYRQLGLSPHHLAEASQPQRKYLTALRLILTSRLSESELRNLCFDLSVNYGNLPGSGTADKARELIAHLDRHGGISELMDAIRKLRPQVEFGRYLPVTEEAQEGEIFLHVCS